MTLRHVTRYMLLRHGVPGQRSDRWLGQQGAPWSSWQEAAS